jgi:gliding motility-associated-like protein
MMRLKTYIFVLFFLSKTQFAQQLVINEVSQGPTGAKEYVELLVVGTPTCNAIPCMDLRNYIIDDNNGNHATGAGVGIAAGCVRLQNIPFWQCIPYGTIIVFYNDADQNASIPAQDLSMIDGNCRLVIPISNCTLLERHTTLPSTALSPYPTTGFVGCGNWTQISMANGDDSFQTINASGALLHSVSWNNNTLATIIYFPGAAGGNVAIMTNAFNNNPATQANWVMLPVAGNETPGSPNNAANAAWISTMNNGCLPLLPLTTTVTSTSAGCSCNGSATVAASGAIGPYTYTWFPSGGNSTTASGLCAGIYTVSITSSNGCSDTQTVNIVSAGSVSVTTATTSVTCNGLANGSATATPSGGTGPYTFTWSPSGGNSFVATGLAPGTYTVLVKDVNNCTVTASALITQPSTSLTAITSAINILCFGATNGSTSVTASGGTAGYTYTWSPSGGNTNLASALTAGTYTVLVKDANNCTVTATALITQPASALAATINFTNATCGMSNGSAMVNPVGGTSAYSFSWSPIGGTAPLAINLSAGNYSVVITDANNCQLTKTVTIIQPNSMVFTVTTTSVSCNSGSNGTATLNVAGGSAPYSYTWSPVPGGGQGTSIVTGLSSQTYTVLISDNLGCTTFTTATIIQPATALNAITTATNILCFGAVNGSASVTASGGTAGYTYTWSPVISNASAISSLTVGSYTVLVMDANNCTVTASAIVSQPIAPLTTIITATNILCFGNNNGSAGVIANGGTPGYTYNWIPTGGTNNLANNLAPGNYTVIVKDINNCTVNTFTSISQPTAALGASVLSNNVTCNGGSNGSSTITATGGTVGYTFTWLPSLASSSLNAGLSAGTHTAFVQDANNCTFSLTTTISQPAPITLNVNPIKLCSGQNGVLLGNVNGGTAPYSYTWNNVPGSFSVAVSTTANVIYTLSVTDANGCNSPIDTAMINVSPPLTLSISPTKTICAGTSSGLSANAFGGNGIYQYNWLPNNIAGQLISVNLNNTTVYTVTVNDGCSQPVIATTTIFVETVPTPTLLANKYSGCSPVCVSFTNTAFNPTLSIQNSLWTFSDGSFATGQQPNHCFTNKGTFTATNSFTTTSGCKNTVQLTNYINVFQKPDAEFSASNYLFENSNPEVNFYNNSANAINYFWDFGGLGSSTLVNPGHSFNEPGKYLVTLIAMNGFCSDTAYKIIECLPAYTFYAPNTFTPNNDKRNDFFFPIGEGWDVKTYSLMVFDRWGEKIYETDQVDGWWAGTFKGEEVKEDTYIWKVNLKDIFGMQHNYVGHITVIR